MALLAIHNQRSAAISQYEHCRQLLREELGVEPEEDTVRLYEQIRQGKYTQPTIKESERMSIRLAKPSRTPFVGRQLQLEKLHQALGRALEGQVCGRGGAARATAGTSRPAASRVRSHRRDRRPSVRAGSNCRSP